jgi:hypothetical protein
MAASQPATATAQAKKTQAVGFSIRLDTARTGLPAKLQAVKAIPDLVDPKTKQVIKPADQSQAQLAVKLIQDRVDALSPDFDGVLVIAEGVQDLDAGRCVLTIQIYGKKGHI